MAFRSCLAALRSFQSSWSRIPARRAHITVCRFTNHNLPLPFRENSRRSITKYGQRFHFSTRWSIPALPSRGYFYLNRMMVAWIGRGGSIACPPRSPDLTLLDFSVLGYVEDNVSVPLLSVNLEGICAKVTEAVATRDTDRIYRIL